MPEILPIHFEMAMREARRSVSDADLEKYSRFAVNLNQQRGNMGTNVSSFSFPNRGIPTSNAPAAGGGAAPVDEEEDLYS